MSQLKETVQWVYHSLYTFVKRPVTTRDVRYLGIAALLAGAISVSIGLGTAQGTNIVEQDVDGFVCNIHQSCGPDDTGVATIDIPATGRYAVYIDTHADSLDEQLNESVYLTFDQDGSSVTPENPNAGSYFVVPDQEGVEYQHDAYAGTFEFTKGDARLDVHHYAKIWNEYPAFYKDSDDGKEGPESVDVIHITCVHIVDDPCANNTAPVAAISPTNVTVTVGESVTLNADNSTDNDGDTLSYVWNIDGVASGTGTTLSVPTNVAGTYLVTLTVADQCAENAIETLVTVTKDTPQGPQCGMYGVHDAGSSKSQLFSVDTNGNVSLLGGALAGYDIEATDIHPQTGVWYGVSGNGGFKNGTVYTFNKTTGAVSEIGHTGLSGDEIVSASFSPDGTLYAWRENYGLYTINLSNGAATFVWHVSGSGVGDNWEGLTWDLDGNYLYGSHGSKLYRWNPTTQQATLVCGQAFLPYATEALDTRPDGTLIGGYHNASNPNMAMFEIDTNACTVAPANYALGNMNDIESLTYDVCTPHDPCEGHVDPVAVIDPTSATITLGQSQTFDGSGSSDADGDALTYEWSVEGTNYTSANQSIIETPTQVGTYNLSLKVTDQCGSDIAQAVLTVNKVPDQCEGNHTPVADIDPTTQTITLGETASFDGSNSSDIDGDTLTYVWSVDGESYTGTTDSFSFTPTAVGTYTVHLSVSDDCSSDLETAIVVVTKIPDQCEGNHEPVADLTPVSKTIYLGESVTFDASGSTDADGDTLVYAWDVVGEPIVGIPNNPTFTLTPSAIGTYTVKVTVSDDCASDNTTAVVTVVKIPNQCEGNNAPVATVTPTTQTITLGETASLDGSGSTDADGDTLTYAWTVEGESFTGTTETFSFTPTAVGTYTVNLGVSDDCDPDTETATVIVTKIPDQCIDHQDPTIVITPQNQTIYLGESVTFDSSSSSDADGDAISFAWTVSNTTEVFTTNTITVTPTSTGVYTIGLKGTDICGDNTAETILTVIKEPGQCNPDQDPIANAGPDFPVDQGQPVYLDGSASYDPDGDPISYHWTVDALPGFSADTATTTITTITERGHYRATLTVANECGSDTDVVEFEIVGGGGCTGPNCNQCIAGEAPVAIAGDDKSVAVGETFTLDGSASYDPESEPLTYHWAIAGTGFSANTAIATTSISSPGKYTAVLTVADQCTVDSDELIIDVTGGSGQCVPNGLPVAIAGNDVTITAGESVVLDGTSSYDPDGDVLSYFWEIPSLGFTSVNPTASLVITETGVHTAILSVKDQCSLDSDSLQITVKTPPTVLGTSTTSFVPPTESPRAGGMPIAAAGAGAFSGLFASIGAWISMKRRSVKDTLVNFIQK